MIAKPGRGKLFPKRVYVAFDKVIAVDKSLCGVRLHRAMSDALNEAINIPDKHFSGLMPKLQKRFDETGTSMPTSIRNIPVETPSLDGEEKLSNHISANRMSVAFTIGDSTSLECVITRDKCTIDTCGSSIQVDTGRLEALKSFRELLEDLATAILGER